MKDRLSRVVSGTSLESGVRRVISLLIVSSALSIIALAAGEIWSYAGYAYAGLMVGILIALLISISFSKRLLRHLNAMPSGERDARAASSEFLMRISHELRTLLNGALDNVELLLERRPASPNEQALLNVIHNDTSASLRYLDNVTDFAKIETGQVTFARTEFDLHALLNGVAALLRRVADRKDVKIMLRIAPDTPFLLVGDSHYLRAILLNLMSSIMPHAEHGRMWLDVTKKSENGLSATLRFEVVEDAGSIGTLDGIFSRSDQEDAVLSQDSNGFIVAIARRLVELMGGRIGMETVSGRNAILWFELPFAKQSTEGIDVSVVDGRALILSRDAQLVASYTRLFPCQLVQSTSTEELIEMLMQASRLGNAFHLVLIDDSMMVGADLAATDLYEKALAMNVPVILVTDKAPTIGRLRELGVSAVLSRTPTVSLAYAALHASPSWIARSDSNVATVAPWLWSGREKARRPRILVADDIQTNLLVTGRMLEEVGYDVDAVNSGDEALKRLLAGGYRLAILDMHMPGFDGPEVLRRYRTLRPRSPVPIIMLTANVSLVAQQTCAEAGADAYLAKPVTAFQLLGEVKRLLNMHKVEIVPFGAKPAATRAVEDEEVLDVTVLAELDRLSRDPRELKTWIYQYEREGRNLLAKVGAAGQSRDHKAYCDAVHALKSTAANVGARKLMAACQRVGALAFAEFLRDRDSELQSLRQDFDESLVALRGLNKYAG